MTNKRICTSKRKVKLMLGNIENKLKENYDMTFGGAEKGDVYCRTLFPSMLSLHNAVLGNDEKLVPVNRELTISENEAARERLVQYLRLALNLMENTRGVNKRVYALYQEKFAFMKDHILLSDAEKALNYLSEDKRRYLMHCYDQLKTKLPKPTRKMLEECSVTFDDMLALIGADIKDIKRLFPNRKARHSFEVLHTLCEELRAEFNHCWALSDEALDLLWVQHCFPYLPKEDWPFVANHHRKYGYYPRFYILRRYLSASLNKHHRIFCLYNGLLDGVKHTVSEISEAMGFTAPWVSSLIDRQLMIKESGLTDAQEWQHYASLLAMAYITDDSPLLRLIQERELPDCDLSQVGALIELLGEEGQYERVELQGITIILNRKFLPSFDLPESFKQLSRQIAAKYTKTTSWSLTDCAKGLEGEEQKLATGLLAKIAKTLWGLEADNNGNLTFQQNSLSVRQEMYDLLLEAGKPLSYEELFRRFKEKYPAHKYTNPGQLKRTILQHPLIKPIGYSGTYRLKDWNYVFNGTIRDLIEEQLQMSSAPVHLNVLLENVLRYFPKTNKNSLRSLLVTDKANRFVHFGKGYYGLRSVSYGDRYEELKFIRKHMDFKETLALLRQFVEVHGHLPFQYQEPSEKALFKWLAHIKAGATRISDTERQELEATLREYSEKHIPTNITENDFKLNCERFLLYVKNNGVLPTKKREQQLYNWWMHSKQKVHMWQGHRPHYWEEVLKQLTNLGIDF